jgi:hypothetical protein
MSVTCEDTCLFGLAASSELKGILVISRACKDEQKGHACWSRDPVQHSFLLLPERTPQTHALACGKYLASEIIVPRASND